jgi:flagellar hook-basal body complex protein FliE
MAEAIDPISIEMKLAQILGDDFLAQAPTAAPGPTPAAEPAGRTEFSGNMFEDILSQAISALEGVSRTEIYANQLVGRYLKGEVDLKDVMVAQAKMSIMVQLAVTTVNSAVNTFKEITGMQI